jgi:hypothetical protein
MIIELFGKLKHIHQEAAKRRRERIAEQQTPIN